MNKAILDAQLAVVKQQEAFWFAQHRDAQSDRDLNDYGWMWAHYKELRQRLEGIIAIRAAAREEGGR